MFADPCEALFVQIRTASRIVRGTFVPKNNGSDPPSATTAEPLPVLLPEQLAESLGEKRLRGQKQQDNGSVADGVDVAVG